MKFVLIFCFLIVFCSAQKQCTVSDPDKVDCGYVGINQQQCEAKGCCWVPKMSETFLSSTPNDNVPWCFFPAGANPCQNFTMGATNPGFDQNFYNGMYTKFMLNIDIQGKGGVVAAPDANTPGGSYIFDWMRDESLTMRTFMEINNYDLTKIQAKMNQWVQWVLKLQNEPDPNGIDVRTEPKFNLPDGSVFTGGWCRPQNDGPALRSSALMIYANILINAGQKNYVQQYLWTGNPNQYNGGAIKFDLDYIVTGWSTTTCDLWEEIRSDNFFWNKMSFNYALQMGSEFAYNMGDQSASNTYKTTNTAVTATIYPHYNGAYVQESTNRQKDSAVIHAFVSLNNGVYNITASKEVAQTVKTLNQLFCLTFPINSVDDGNKVPGILYGRYQGDNYAGGNPWQLLTAALAQLYYEQASSMKGRSSITTEEFDNWKDLLNLPSGATAQTFYKAALEAGDSVMYRMYLHVKDPLYDFRIDEQINKSTGLQCSAKSLTWSYANILRALHFRNSFVSEEEQIQ